MDHSTHVVTYREQMTDYRRAIHNDDPDGVPWLIGKSMSVAYGDADLYCETCGEVIMDDPNHDKDIAFI